MDGDGQYSKDHDKSQFPSRLGMGRRAVPRPSGGATNRFRQTNALPSARGDATVLSQATGRPQMPSSSYVGYGYTDTAFQVQQGMPQLQPYPSSNFTQQQQQAQQQQQQQQQQLQPSHSQHHPSFNNPYEQAAVYNLPQQGPTHGPYDAVPQYPTRQSAATIDALSSQFAVPQYFPASEPTGAAVTDMVSPYLNTQLPPYNQPGPIGRSSATAHPFAANMVDLNNPMGTTGQHYQQQQPLPPPQPIQQPIQQPQPQQRQPVATVSTTSRYDEVRGQLQRAFRWTLDQARAGRVVEASRSILEISDWLVVNVREIGTFPPCRYFFSLFPSDVPETTPPLSFLQPGLEYVSFELAQQSLSSIYTSILTPDYQSQSGDRALSRRK